MMNQNWKRNNSANDFFLSQFTFTQINNKKMRKWFLLYDFDFILSSHFIFKVHSSDTIYLFNQTHENKFVVQKGKITFEKPEKRFKRIYYVIVCTNDVIESDNGGPIRTLLLTLEINKIWRSSFICFWISEMT